MSKIPHCFNEVINRFVGALILSNCIPLSFLYNAISDTTGHATEKPLHGYQATSSHKNYNC